MQVSASTFSDPALRPQLEKYYESKKAALIESLNARETQSPGEVKLRTADGEVKTATIFPISADKMVEAIVGFDKWLEFQADSFDRFGARSLEVAQLQLDRLTENGPDSSSDVRATFSSGGVLLAYVNADGTLVTSNGSQHYLQPVSRKADELGLTGQSRVDYLSREIENALSQHYGDLDVASYSDATMPTKREFADLWYRNFNIDRSYEAALANARAHFDTVNAWYQQWQKNMNEIQAFLLSLQEAA